MSECNKVGQKEHKTRHDSVRPVILTELYQKQKLDYASAWYIELSMFLPIVSHFLHFIGEFFFYIAMDFVAIVFSPLSDGFISKKSKYCYQLHILEIIIIIIKSYW